MIFVAYKPSSFLFDCCFVLSTLFYTSDTG